MIFLDDFTSLQDSKCGHSTGLSPTSFSRSQDFQNDLNCIRSWPGLHENYKHMKDVQATNSRIRMIHKSLRPQLTTQLAYLFLQSDLLSLLPRARLASVKHVIAK